MARRKKRKHAGDKEDTQIPRVRDAVWSDDPSVRVGCYERQQHLPRQPQGAPPLRPAKAAKAAPERASHASPEAAHARGAASGAAGAPPAKAAKTAKAAKHTKAEEPHGASPSGQWPAGFLQQVAYEVYVKKAKKTYGQ